MSASLLACQSVPERAHLEPHDVLLARPEPSGDVLLGEVEPSAVVGVVGSRATKTFTDGCEFGGGAEAAVGLVGLPSNARGERAESKDGKEGGTNVEELLDVEAVEI